MSELISCVCPTWNRPEMLQRLLDVYDSQTYSNKELIILDDSKVSTEGTKFMDNIRGREDVQYIYWDKRRCIGAKRNILCEVAKSDLIAHFDDDDESAPDRLEHQFNLMDESKAPIVGYHTILFHEDETGRVFKYFNSIRYAVGASFLFRKSICWENNRFTELQMRNSDGIFYEAVYKQAKVVNGSNHLVAHIHSKGTNRRPVDTDPFYEEVDREMLPSWFSTKKYGIHCV